MKNSRLLFHIFAVVVLISFHVPKCGAADALPASEFPADQTAIAVTKLKEIATSLIQQDCHAIFVIPRLLGTPGRLDPLGGEASLAAKDTGYIVGEDIRFFAEHIVKPERVTAYDTPATHVLVPVFQKIPTQPDSMPECIFLDHKFVIRIHLTKPDKFRFDIVFDLKFSQWLGKRMLTPTQR